MDRRDWRGVYPSMTTPFRDNLSVYYEAVEHQASWPIQSGCSGLAALGSLGEAPSFRRKRESKF
jgi:dihydrodipicolinate synthase/N-acetylneuraminate lyase